MNTRTQYDEYGFPLLLSVEEAGRFRVLHAERDAQLAKKWNAFIKTFGSVEQIDITNNQFKKLVRGGIYHEYRSCIWGKLTGLDNRMHKSKGFYDQLKSLQHTVPDSIKQAISIDVSRTFADATGVNGTQISNVLLAFALVHPEIGYCQSLNFLAAVFIAVLGEERALWMLAIYVERYVPSRYFSHQMLDFQIDLRLLERLIEERIPDVYQHTQELHHEWMTCSSGWLLASFSNTFPIPTVLRIWDSFFLEGQKIIFRCAIAFIRLYHDEFMAAPTLSAFTTQIEHAQSHMIDSDALLDAAFAIKAFSRSHLLDVRASAKSEVEHSPDNSKESVARALHAMFGRMNL